ncbi:hypothetical protein C448_03581 [Halococcus morrhuae DSM 1307]|uniref:DUF7119 domain-containing protein n=1 Tax=Halococcus morrhuae DSM 1307 TaxID=931277 RepID=M0MV60_HALMO|nr:hypothetical protein [Halococcus morrhuae]EMA48325.1 hypothetical protein C448_03581 [Halococcus morrhuae DSM 1307]
MTPDDAPDGPTDRESPVGQPVVRGDPAFAGEHAEQAVQFDPDDPDSLSRAADIVERFADDSIGAADSVYMLRGAAACAALVRGEGSYKAAAERADEGVTVSFIRKWARVHDLPRPIRQYVATGDIAPTAAKHIARVTDRSRYLLAWAVLDGDLTVREVRSVASAINAGTDPEAVLDAHDVTLGEMTLRLPRETYTDLRRQAAREGVDPAVLVAEALNEQPTDPTTAERY